MATVSVKRLSWPVVSSSIVNYFIVIIVSYTHLQMFFRASCNCRRRRFGFDVLC